MTDDLVCAASARRDFPRQLALTTGVLLALSVCAQVHAQEPLPKKLMDVDLSHRSGVPRLVAADLSGRPGSSFSAGVVTDMAARNDAVVRADAPAQISVIKSPPAREVLEVAVAATSAASPSDVTTGEKAEASRQTVHVTTHAPTIAGGEYGSVQLMASVPPSARAAATTVDTGRRSLPEPTFIAQGPASGPALTVATPQAPVSAQAPRAAPDMGSGSVSPQLQAAAQVPPGPSRPALDTRLASMSSPKRDDAAGISDDWLAEVSTANLAPWNEGGMDENAVRALLRPAVEAAGRNSPRVQQAWSEYLASESDTKAVKGQRWPRVDVSSSTRSYAIGKDDDDNPALRPAVDLQIVTPLYDFGRTKNTITSYSELSNAAQSRFQAEVDAVSAQTAALIIEIEKNRTLAQASQTHVDRISALVYMLGEIVKVDGGRGSELTQAKARMLQASASHEAILARIVDLEIQLRKLAGEGPYPRASTATWYLQPSESGPLMAALEQHPQIQQARHETASAEANAQAVKSSAYPQVNWVVEKTTAEDALGRSQPWETHLTLSWGAFRGGALRAQRQAALARAEAGRQKAEQIRLDIEYEIRTAQHDARVLLDRAKDYGMLAVENDRVRRAFFQQWHYLGRRSLLDVLSAENEFYANQVSEITSRFDGYGAIIKSYSSAGMLRNWLNP